MGRIIRDEDGNIIAAWSDEFHEQLMGHPEVRKAWLDRQPDREKALDELSKLDQELGLYDA